MEDFARPEQSYSTNRYPRDKFNNNAINYRVQDIQYASARCIRNFAN